MASFVRTIRRRRRHSRHPITLVAAGLTAATVTLGHVKLATASDPDELAGARSYLSDSSVGEVPAPVLTPLLAISPPVSGAPANYFDGDNVRLIWEPVGTR